MTTVVRATSLLSLLGIAIFLAACASQPERKIPIFFDLGSSTLSPTALDIVKSAAARIADTHPDSITVIGHAEGATPAAALVAADRATAVEKALEQDGVDPAHLSVATGEPSLPGAVAARTVEIEMK